MLPFLDEIVTPLHCIYLMQSLHQILSNICKYLMMESSIWQMVRTRTSEELVIDISEGPAGRGRGQAPRGNAPPHLLVIFEQLLATQNDLMRTLVKNDKRRGAEHPQH
jgi:hypothetical protein